MKNKKLGLSTTQEFQLLFNTFVGHGKFFAPNEMGINAFMKVYNSYISNKK